MQPWYESLTKEELYEIQRLSRSEQVYASLIRKLVNIIEDLEEGMKPKTRPASMDLVHQEFLEKFKRNLDEDSGTIAAEAAPLYITPSPPWKLKR